MAGMEGQMLDHYRLVEQKGQGGMATVYRAVDSQSLQEFAIKVLSPTIGGDKRFVKRRDAS
jgi:serine/threonine protein kinase